MKAIAAQRGWPHQSHQDVHEVARQVALEYGIDSDQRDALTDAYRVGHENFYENQYNIEELADLIERVEDLVPYLHWLTAQPPRQFTITSERQLRRLRRLTGNDALAIGDSSTVGFSV